MLILKLKQAYAFWTTVNILHVLTTVAGTDSDALAEQNI